MTLWYHFAPHVCNFLPFSSKNKVTWLAIWTKMAKSYKHGGQNGTKVSFWTKMANMPKPQGRKWQFTL
ncbi:hypothetical protein Hanom_Chr15g01364431 [Helianthus anomalus]